MWHRTVISTYCVDQYNVKADLEILGTESGKELLESAVGGPPQKMAPFPPQDGGGHGKDAGHCVGMPAVACPCWVTLARSLDIWGPRFVMWNSQGRPSHLASIGVPEVCLLLSKREHVTNRLMGPSSHWCHSSQPHLQGPREAAWLKVTETVRLALIPYVIAKLLVIDLIGDVTSTMFAFHMAPSFSPCLRHSWTLRSAAERSF